nr:hypothetical protein [Candidatus Sigynarchaeota archaeon]
NEQVSKTLKEEYQLLMFFDMLYANPLVFVHDNRTKEKYMKILSTFMESRPKLKEYWARPEREVFSAVKNMLGKGDVFASSRGMARSPASMVNIITLVIFGGIFTFMILSSFIPSLAPIGTPLLYIGLCVVCIVPNMLKQQAMKKVTRFQDEHLKDFMKENVKELDIVHDAAQYLISDMREALLDQNIELDSLRFQLRNSDYKGIRVLQQGKPAGQIFMAYVVRFLKDGENPDELPAVETGPDADVDFSVDKAEDETDDVDDAGPVDADDEDVDDA